MCPHCAQRRRCSHQPDGSEAEQSEHPGPSGAALASMPSFASTWTFLSSRCFSDVFRACVGSVLRAHPTFTRGGDSDIGQLTVGGADVLVVGAASRTEIRHVTQTRTAGPAIGQAGMGNRSFGVPTLGRGRSRPHGRPWGGVREAPAEVSGSSTGLPRDCIEVAYGVTVMLPLFVQDHVQTGEDGLQIIGGPRVLSRRGQLV